MDPGLFCFYLSGEKDKLSPDSRLWSLPLSGESDIPPGQSSSKESDIRIGDYFLACAEFLSRNDFGLLIKGAAVLLEKKINDDRILRIDLNLEKHGAFYHPVNVTVIFPDNLKRSFVLNGAVSESGLSLIEDEYHRLLELNKSVTKQFIPSVFDVGFVRSEKGLFGFFLGEWFEGYKEFHITKVNRGKKIAIWESDGSCSYISSQDAYPVYKEIAYILTQFYDVESFKQIFPWHHAAGDFVVKLDGDDIQVRLITIRGYSAITEFTDNISEKKTFILPSLLFFFLYMTIQMRLDRLDGTGRSEILPEEINHVTTRGFLDALEEKSDQYDYGNIKTAFIDFFKQFDPEQLKGIIRNILKSSSPHPSEIPLINDNLTSHCHSLDSIFKNL